MNFSTNNFDKLINDLGQMPLVLFLGAGVNAPIVPLWKNLLDELLKPVADKIISLSGDDFSLRGTLINKLEKLSEYEKATLAKSLLGKNYFSYLRSQLYQRYEDLDPPGSDYHPNKLKPQNGIDPFFLREVRGLCDNFHVQAIVSYNYDDILLNAINRGKKRKAFCVRGNKRPEIFNKKALPIYYVHGFIPCAGKLPSINESDIVLSRDEYFRIMLEPYSWQTTVQLYFLQNYVSLFLGTSLSDWNMMRMLSTAKAYSPLRSVYYLGLPIQENTPKEQKETINIENLQMILSRTHATLLEDLGVKAIFPRNNNYTEVYRLVNELKSSLDEMEKGNK